MGCFLGCFGGSNDHKHRKQRIDRPDLRNQRSRVQNGASQRISHAKIQQGGSISTPEKSTVPTTSNKLILDLNKPLVPEQPNPSPRKRVTFNTNVITYEHVPERESISSLQDFITEKEEDVKMTAQPHSESEGETSIATSTVRSYPPNHRYHNIRDSDDEAEYDFDDLEDDFKDCDDDDEDEDGRKVRTTLTPPPNNGEVKVFGSRVDLRNTTVLSPVENVTQWKAATAKFNEAPRPLNNNAQKENLVSNSETTRSSFNSESPFLPKKAANREISVDASLSNWLSSSPDTVSSGRTTSSVRAFEDRPILGALTVEELKQISASPPQKKSPSSSRSTDEIPIIGTVGSYWTDSASSASFKGIPNTTSKYREENSVKWHSTPFETRLDRVLARGCS